MKLTNWFLNFDFNGRGRRSHSWANWACWLATWLVVLIIASALGAVTETEETGNLGGALGSILMTLVGAVAAVDVLAMAFRRAHDTGKSGWICILLLVPLANLLALYWLLIEDSHQGSNKYGPAVKQFYEPGSARPDRSRQSFDGGRTEPILGRSGPVTPSLQ